MARWKFGGVAVDWRKRWEGAEEGGSRELEEKVGGEMEKTGLKKDLEKAEEGAMEVDVQSMVSQEPVVGLQEEVSMDRQERYGVKILCGRSCIPFSLALSGYV